MGGAPTPNDALAVRRLANVLESIIVPDMSRGTGRASLKYRANRTCSLLIVPITGASSSTDEPPVRRAIATLAVFRPRRIIRWRHLLRYSGTLRTVTCIFESNGRELAASEITTERTQCQTLASAKLVLCQVAALELANDLLDLGNVSVRPTAF
jgi:hypothetical protein